MELGRRRAQEEIRLRLREEGNLRRQHSSRRVVHRDVLRSPGREFTRFTKAVISLIRAFAPLILEFSNYSQVSKKRELILSSRFSFLVSFFHAFAGCLSIVFTAMTWGFVSKSRASQGKN